MNLKKSAFLLLLLLLNLPAHAQKTKGEKLLQPEIFGDGVISTISEYETHPSFSPDGETIYFLRCAADISKSTIYFSARKNGKWSEPQIAAFSGKYFDADPFFTKDGRTMFFTSNRPLADGEPAKTDTDIWKVEKTSDGNWGKPVHLGAPLSSAGDEHYPTLADNGNLYFGSSRAGGKGGSDIYFAKFENGKYLAPVNLGEMINTENNEYEPFIEKDEKFMIFMATVPKGLANADFYVSYNRKGVWSQPEKLPALINSEATEWAPKITRDGKRLFFGSTRARANSNEKIAGLSDIYYIGIDALKLKRK